MDIKLPFITRPMSGLNGRVGMAGSLAPNRNNVGWQLGGPENEKPTS